MNTPTTARRKENVVLPTEMSNEVLGQYVATESVGILKRMDVLKPYFQELWKRFDELREGETISECRTRTEFCEKILHRTRRSVQYILHGRTQKKLPPPKVERVAPAPEKENLPKPTACAICDKKFPSNGAMKTHRRKSHEEEMAARQNKSLRGVSTGEPQVPPADGGSIDLPEAEREMVPSVAYKMFLRGIGYERALEGYREKLKRARTDGALPAWEPGSPTTVKDFTESWNVTRTWLYGISDDPPPSAEQPADLSETFYVIRRKSDGTFYFNDSFGELRYAMKRDAPEENEVVLYHSDKTKLRTKVNRVELERGGWEWVKVEASYKLTTL